MIPSKRKQLEEEYLLMTEFDVVEPAKNKEFSAFDYFRRGNEIK